MKLHFVDQMDEVLTLALESPLIALAPGENDVMGTIPPTELTANLPARQ
jgi:hypothetical protein